MLCEKISTAISVVTIGLVYGCVVVSAMERHHASAMSIAGDDVGVDVGDVLGELEGDAEGDADGETHSSVV